MFSQSVKIFQSGLQGTVFDELLAACKNLMLCSDARYILKYAVETVMGPVLFLTVVIVL